jgi:hypothetical protein
VFGGAIALEERCLLPKGGTYDYLLTYLACLVEPRAPSSEDLQRVNAGKETKQFDLAKMEWFI